MGKTSSACRASARAAKKEGRGGEKCRVRNRKHKCLKCCPDDSERSYSTVHTEYRISPKLGKHVIVGPFTNDVCKVFKILDPLVTQ